MADLTVIRDRALAARARWLEVELTALIEDPDSGREKRIRLTVNGSSQNMDVVGVGQGEADGSALTYRHVGGRKGGLGQRDLTTCNHRVAVRVAGGGAAPFLQNAV